MPTLKVISNIDQVVSSEISMLNKLASAELVLRQAAFDSLVLISDRVQQKGRNASGQAFNGYSEGHKRRRSKVGKQVAFVDLTLTDQGGMMDSFQVGISPEGAEVGFVDARSAEIAGYNEERYGMIFELTEQEQAVVKAQINEDLDEIFNTI